MIFKKNDNVKLGQVEGRIKKINDPVNVCKADDLGQFFSMLQRTAEVEHFIPGSKELAVSTWDLGACKIVKTAKILQEFYRNACLTGWRALGHNKGQRNETLASEYKEELERIGAKVPTSRECSDFGVFNGRGAS